MGACASSVNTQAIFCELNKSTAYYLSLYDATPQQINRVLELCGDKAVLEKTTQCIGKTRAFYKPENGAVKVNEIEVATTDLCVLEFPRAVAFNCQVDDKMRVVYSYDPDFLLGALRRSDEFMAAARKWAFG